MEKGCRLIIKILGNCDISSLTQHEKENRNLSKKDFVLKFNAHLLMSRQKDSERV